MSDRYKHLTRAQLEPIKADLAKQRQAIKTVVAGAYWTNSFAPTAFAGISRWVRDQEAEVDAAIARIDDTIRPVVPAIDEFRISDRFV
jgi:hypothetical protein